MNENPSAVPQITTATTVAVAPTMVAPALEKRGRAWLLWSFLLCPCHLPLSLGVLAMVLGGTSLGTLFRDHAWIAGTIITLTWLIGTTYGFSLIRKSQKFDGACPTR